MERITIHSLEELGEFADLIAPTDSWPVPTVAEAEAPLTDLASLAAAASRAAAQLQELVERDAVARREAELALSHHHRLQEEIAQLSRIAAETYAVVERAAELSTGAFDPACRESAGEVSTAVRAVATSTAAMLARLQQEALELEMRPDVARLLEEELAAAEALRQQEAEREKREALQAQLDEVDSLLRDGKENEAEELLGHLVSEQPNEPAEASRIDNLRRRLWGVKTVRIEAALREARRCYRHEPRQALDRLEALDLANMPEELVRQVYGCWLDACRRLHLAGAVHYSPSFGKGAVLTPAADDRLEVVSALGLQRWHAGARFSAAGLRGVHPLS